MASRPSGYSCNDNQNYFVEGRSTSRVLSEPGGKSSISLAWGDPSNANPKKEGKKNEKEVSGKIGALPGMAPEPAAAEKENTAIAGTVAAPEESAADLMGGGTPAQKAAPSSAPTASEPVAGKENAVVAGTVAAPEESAASLIFGGPTPSKAPAPAPAKADGGKKDSRNLSSHAFGDDDGTGMRFSNNSFASGASMNAGGIPISDRPSSRVLNPPGGNGVGGCSGRR